MRNQKGFTLMEMLIVVAIIAILIVISVSTLATSLERTRESRDLSTIKSAFSELSGCLIMDTPKDELPSYIQCTEADGKITSYYTFVESTQKTAKWQSGAVNYVGESDADYILVHSAYIPCPTSFTGKAFKLEAFVAPKAAGTSAGGYNYTESYQYDASVVDKGSNVLYKSSGSK